MNQPKVLIFDIETSPITAYTWGLYDQNLGLNQIKEDWHLLAWAAKWLGDPPSKVIYMDNRKSKDVKDDTLLIKGLWNILNQADIVIAQNGDKFDIKKFNARAVILGLSPVKPFKSTDTLKESRKVFSFTSHSLEYMSQNINKKYKKLKHDKYPGFELWKAVLNGDKKAWVEMQKYCIHDVLATEELYQTIQGWIKTQNVNSYSSGLTPNCPCGSFKLEKRGFAYTDTGKYQVFRCIECGKWPRSKENLLSQDKKRSLLK